jgi:ABC-type branched-subunit amino acid transport system ATPase component
VTVARGVNAEQAGLLTNNRATVALDVRDLLMNFAGVQAVAGASFQIEEGKITGLIGPNGAGKSTVIDILSGFRKPTGGTVQYLGRNIAGWPAHRVARAGIIRTFQLSSEFPRLSVLENLLAAVPGIRGGNLGAALLGRRYWGAEQAQAVAEARERLARFGLGGAEDARAGQLSAGQKRLLELARAVTAKPRLLLLDEPFAGVNPTLAVGIEEAVIALRDEGVTILLVEHEMGAVERLCADILVMANGRVLTRGNMAVIRANPEVVDAYLGG